MLIKLNAIYGLRGDELALNQNLLLGQVDPKLGEFLGQGEVGLAAELFEKGLDEMKFMREWDEY